MTAIAFDVSVKEFRFLSEFRDDPKGPMLLIRFAPNPELTGHRDCFEWQIDVADKITDYLDVPLDTKGEFCAMLVPSGFSLAGLSEARANEVWKSVSISDVMPHAIGIMTENLIQYITPLMHDLARAFAQRGMKVVAVGKYGPGGFGPSHFLRDGVIYKRRGE